MKIALDIGHGIGNSKPGVYDPGAVGNGYQEHVIVRGMAYRLKADLEALGHSVLLTTGLLTSRDDTAKRWGAELLVSLHCNSHTTASATGVECWIDTSASTRGKAVAASITKRLAASIAIANRGVKVKNFAVLRANPHDVLVEMFFISNATDVRKYQANVNGHELAILNGILEGLGQPIQGKLPRIGKQPVEAEYVEIRIHSAIIDKAEYKQLAKTLDDFCLVKPTTKDSWKGWQ